MSPTRCWNVKCGTVEWNSRTVIGWLFLKCLFKDLLTETDNDIFLSGRVDWCIVALYLTHLPCWLLATCIFRLGFWFCLQQFMIIAYVYLNVTFNFHFILGCADGNDSKFGDRRNTKRCQNQLVNSHLFSQYSFFKALGIYSILNGANVLVSATLN